jgi:hypothetical protein
LTWTHFTFRLDIWTPDGESIVHVAGIEDYEVALATYHAACRPDAPHHLAARGASDRELAPKATGPRDSIRVALTASRLCPRPREEPQARPMISP